MNTAIVKSVPPGKFEEVNIHMADWETLFLKLIQERKPIRYDIFTMPTLSKDIQEELSKQRYRRLILEDDKDQHFLTPIGGITP